MAGGATQVCAWYALALGGGLRPARWNEGVGGDVRRMRTRIRVVVASGVRSAELRGVCVSRG